MQNVRFAHHIARGQGDRRRGRIGCLVRSFCRISSLIFGSFRRFQARSLRLGQASDSDPAEHHSACSYFFVRKHFVAPELIQKYVLFYLAPLPSKITFTVSRMMARSSEIERCLM